MVDREKLLSDLQAVLRTLEADLLDRSDSDEVPEVREWLRAEYTKAKDAERTAQTQQQWTDDFITQVAAAWVLSCVFVRFLEDNGLIDPPKIAGPGGRLERARDEHTLFFQDPNRAKLTDREYLLDNFHSLAKVPAVGEVFGKHNPLNTLPNWLGPDAAGELLGLFQKIDANSGSLIHDFTDPEWDTRFLGDLYQDLSEAARKKYALLQTPDFVEEFILDRTLDPALDEFGMTPDTNPDHLFKMIDPACGSGHFLLGAFPRILKRWQKEEPGTNIRELVQRTLDSIHGVDINPFAIAIARFRLLLAALAACGVKRLTDAPAFAMNLACGDSLYHGRQQQLTLGDDWTDESHYFRTEDAEHLRRILKEGTFHCVVANPPYATPKDSAANRAYRQLYSSCHRKYALTVPFMERIFRLAIRLEEERSPGYTGQITATSFMKREFGKKLIEQFFDTVELTSVIDTKGVVFGNPGFGGTSTILIFGRNRRQMASHVRAAMCLRGEPGTPDDPAEGAVWKAITHQIDLTESDSEFISVRELPAAKFRKHPWSLGGGGASELKDRLDQDAQSTVASHIVSSGFGAILGEDEVFSDRPNFQFRTSRMSSGERSEVG
ncbi:MAG: BREX-2 system adenine-specific DNA-methyltransferase PglX [Planctomycetaceae bacterium]